VCSHCIYIVTSTDFRCSTTSTSTSFRDHVNHTRLDGGIRRATFLIRYATLRKFDPTASTFIPSTDSNFRLAYSKSKPNLGAAPFITPRLSLFSQPLYSSFKYREYKAPEFALQNARRDDMIRLEDMLSFTEHGQVGRFSKDTTIEYNSGVHRHDPVLVAMRKTISVLKKQHLHIFEPKFEVEPLDDAAPVWPVGRNPVGVKYYTFEMKKDYGDNFTAPVTIFPTGSYPNADTVHLYKAGEKKWVAFFEWLHTAVDNMSVFTGKNANAMQHGWWKVNGKTFPFLELPCELCDKVYSLALGSNIYPLSTVRYADIDDTKACAAARLMLGMGYVSKDLERSIYGYLSSDRYMPKAPKPVYKSNLALLYVSKQVSAEGLRVGWIRKRKCFFDTRMFTLATRASAGSAMQFSYRPEHPERYGYLGKTELGLSNRAFFELFGVEVDPQFQIVPARSLGPQLQGFKGLRDLQLRFRFPDDGYAGSPWGDGFSKHSLPRYHGHDYICCQRTIVDWICTFAHPFIASPDVTVTLTGAVKKATKDKWEAIFNGSQAHDQTTAMAAIFNTQEALL
jgi:hypothetical protein